MKIVIVGGGISGLSLAYFLLRKEPGLDVEVLESASRPGGKIWTDRAEGYLCEWGVNGFLDNKPRTLELASMLGLAPVRSNDNARKRFIYSDDQLHKLPESPPEFFRSNLLSLRGRLRIIYEIFAPRGTADDETLMDFAVRRLGKEAYEKLIDPMASGIYAGDSSKLSLKSCFPRIDEIERKYGSLIRGMIKLQKEAKGTGKKVGSGPGGTLTTFDGGMHSLIDSLREQLGHRLKIDSEVSSIDRRDKNYGVFLGNGDEMKADILVLATPAHISSKILRQENKEISEMLDKIPYPAVSVACLGFSKEKIGLSLDGFGYLVPYKERRRILGTLWDSSIFPDRAPDGKVLLRTMVGGARASDIALQEDDKIVGDVMSELRAIMGINADPEFVRVYKHDLAIPQYNVGHQRIIASIHAIISKWRGFYLTGNAYRGISLNDCIENSYIWSEKILGLKEVG
ncbi:MAG: protoporphyrinogen oxidase [Nitrospirota bacterium]|nr:MAG: protoporphyrinogen oxidase [Nitrospirota bacterium]